MANISLRERLLARKSEVEQALADLDRIERIAGGEFDVDSAPDLPRLLAKPTTTSIAQRVSDELSGKSLTVQQLASRLLLSENQVRNALTGHRLRKVLTSSKVGGLTRYSINGDGHPHQSNNGVASSGLPTVRVAVLDLLRENPDESFRTIEVSRRLEGKVATTAKNFSATVAATLSDLVKSSRVLKDEHGYRAALKQQSLLSDQEVDQ